MKLFRLHFTIFIPVFDTESKLLDQRILIGEDIKPRANLFQSHARAYHVMTEKLLAASTLCNNHVLKLTQNRVALFLRIQHGHQAAQARGNTAWSSGVDFSVPVPRK